MANTNCRRSWKQFADRRTESPGARSRRQLLQLRRVIPESLCNRSSGHHDLDEKFGGFGRHSPHRFAYNRHTFYLSGLR
jgi:hypothetical protein